MVRYVMDALDVELQGYGRGKRNNLVELKYKKVGLEKGRLNLEN